MIVIKTKALKYYMREAGYSSQVAFAVDLEMTKDRLNKIINNKADGFHTKTLNKMCGLLGVQPGEILEFQPD